MHVILLAAGFGRRLDKISDGMPKALLPLGKGCVLDFVISAIWVKGIKKIHIVHNKRDAALFRGWRSGISWVCADHERKDPPYIKLLNNGVDQYGNRSGSVGDIDFALKSMRNPQSVLIVPCDNIFPPLVRWRELVGESSAITIRRLVDLPIKDADLGRVHFEAGEVTTITSSRDNEVWKKSGWVYAGPAYLHASDFPRLFHYVELHEKALVVPDSLGYFFAKLKGLRPIECHHKPFFEIGTEEGYKSARRFFRGKGTRWRMTKSSTEA